MNEQQQTLTEQLRGTLLDLSRQIQNLDSDGLDSAIFRLEQLASHVVRLCDVNVINDNIQYLITDTIFKLRGVDEFYRSSPFRVETLNSGRPGRPSFDISRDQLEYLLNYELSEPSVFQKVLSLGECGTTVFRFGGMRLLSQMRTLMKKLGKFLDSFQTQGIAESFLSFLLLDGDHHNNKSGNP